MGKRGTEFNPREIPYAEFDAGYFTGAGGRLIGISADQEASELDLGKTVKVEGECEMESEWVRVKDLPA